jgi:hypothetical protein
VRHRTSPDASTTAILDLAHTLPQRSLEVDRPAVLAQRIGEGFVGEILEVWARREERACTHPNDACLKR